MCTLIKIRLHESYFRRDRAPENARYSDWMATELREWLEDHVGSEDRSTVHINDIPRQNRWDVICYSDDHFEVRVMTDDTTGVMLKLRWS